MMNYTAISQKSKTIIDYFKEISYKYPQRTAIEFNEETIEYSFLNEQSSRLAHYLFTQGIQKEDIVGIALDRSPEVVMSLLAILKVGAAYLPIDPELPPERVEFMLEDSNAKLLISESKFENKFNIEVKKIILEDILPTLTEYDIDFENHVKESNLAYIIYTSGSTGKPKGVQIEHKSLSNMLLSTMNEPGIHKEDAFLSAATISFDIIGLELFSPLITGAKIVLASQEVSKDGTKLLNLIEEKNVTIVQGTPSAWHLLLNSGWQKKLPLKAICGGETLSKEFAQKLLARVDSLWNVYGPTETTVYSSYKQIIDPNEINIGVPILNTNIYILDENLNELNPGEVGEICIGGKGVARGYLNRPELSKEKFIKNPFIDGDDTIYRTGDLGKILDNGELVFSGRLDDQIKVRGYRIELGEIENIIEQVTNVKRAIVVVKEDKSGYNQLIAYVNTNETFNKKEIIELLESKLPEYMVPRVIIAIDYIPLTPNGKINKKELPEPTWSTISDTPYAASSNDIEKLILETWKSVLNIDRIGMNDNFFELGGNSILAQQIVNLLAKKNKNLPITKFYQFPTIGQAAGYISKELKKEETTDTEKSNNNINILDTPNLIYSQDNPPVKGALLGKDKNGNPAWFIPHDKIPGKFLQIQL